MLLAYGLPDARESRGATSRRWNAEFIAAQFRSWGYETEIESFDVLFPTPKTRLLLRHPRAVRPWQHVLTLVHGYLLVATGRAEVMTDAARDTTR